jgi:hypothetical protein
MPKALPFLLMLIVLIPTTIGAGTCPQRQVAPDCEEAPACCAQDRSVDGHCATCSSLLALPEHRDSTPTVTFFVAVIIFPVALNEVPPQLFGVWMPLPPDARILRI